MSPQERLEYRTFLVVLVGWLTFTAALAAGLYRVNWMLAVLWVWVCLSVFGYVLHTRLPLRGEGPPVPPASAYDGDPLDDALGRGQ